MSQYFIPSNIFLCRDFKTIIHPVHGEIQIEVVAREGWRAYKDSKTLVSGQDVYGMCAWLNANQCDTIERPNKRVQPTADPREVRQASSVDRQSQLRRG